jgi:hypothetical protein
MIWIDRAALVWAGLLWLVMGLLANGHGHPEDVFNIEVIKAVLVLAGLPWLVLRGFAFVVTGRVRRY